MIVNIINSTDCSISLRNHYDLPVVAYLVIMHSLYSYVIISIGRLQHNRHDRCSEPQTWWTFIINIDNMLIDKNSYQQPFVCHIYDIHEIHCNAVCPIACVPCAQTAKLRMTKKIYENLWHKQKKTHQFMRNANRAHRAYAHSARSSTNINVLADGTSISQYLSYYTHNGRYLLLNIFRTTNLFIILYNEMGKCVNSA